MKVLLQLVATCMLVQVTLATKGLVADSVCDVVCPKQYPGNENLPYIGNCSKFCHCSNDANWDKDCPSGLHFNAALQVCDWPTAAGCNNALIPDSPVDLPVNSNNTCDSVCPAAFPIVDNNRLPFPGNCSRFCHCANDGNWEKECPAGLHFNPVLQVCDLPAAAACNNASIPDSPVDLPVNSNITCDSVCPAAFPIVDNNRLPFPGNCSRFCHCANDGNWEKECPPGLHFNPVLQVCDLPAAAGCNNASIPDSPVDLPVNSNNTCDSVCPAAFPIIDNNRLPFPGNCSRFCHCANDGNWEKECPPGLHFNPVLQVCDLPAAAGCNDTLIPDRPIDLPSNSNNTCDLICPAVFPIIDNNHLPYPGNCSKFCHCANDGNWEKECPSDLHFNRALQVCDWPTSADCTDGTANGCENVTCNNNDCFETSNNIDCQRYCKCDHGNITVKNCSSGLFWNPVTGNCDWEKNVTCDLVPAPAF